MSSKQLMTGALLQQLQLQIYNHHKFLSSSAKKSKTKQHDNKNEDKKNMIEICRDVQENRQEYRESGNIVP